MSFDTSSACCRSQGASGSTRPGWSSWVTVPFHGSPVLSLPGKLPRPENQAHQSTEPMGPGGVERVLGLQVGPRPLSLTDRPFLLFKGPMGPAACAGV